VTPLEYALERFRAFLAEVTRLKEIEFPYQDSKDALERLGGKFEQMLLWLKGFDANSHPDIVNQACAVALSDVAGYLPLLGFVLRSTNVRNAFEVYGPLLRLACQVLEPQTKGAIHLLLSSEWEYSPFVEVYPDLPDFVLIGLPATESSNPLLTPLAGHELGHPLWVRRRLANQIQPRVQQEVITSINRRWIDYQKTFSTVKITPAELTTNLLALQTWEKSMQWAMKQSEESFCDFVGMRIFGRSYLDAFSYLLSPGLPWPCSPHYPDTLRRIDNLVTASQAYGVALDRDYRALFRGQGNPNYTPEDHFQLTVAIDAVQAIMPDLIRSADVAIASAGIAAASEKEVERIYERYLKIVPAEHVKCLADILNAGWKAFENRGRWAESIEDESDKDLTLKDLVLKSIEVFEIEQILEESA
jgi:hypothetical protein